MIVERLPPTPAKPQQIFIERWLPYGQQSQRVVFQPARPPCVIPDPKNVVIQWESPDVEIRREFKNLGVQQADPQQYISQYGSQLVRADALPEIALRYSNQQGVQLAANHRSEGIVIEGDVQALRLIDLDANGLGYLRSRISGSLGDLRSVSVNENIASAGGAAYAAAASGATASYAATSYEAESIGDNVISY